MAKKDTGKAKAPAKPKAKGATKAKAPAKSKKKDTTPEKARRPSTFGMIVGALKKSPQTRKQLTAIVQKNAKDPKYTEEAANKTVPIRLNHLKNKGFTIENKDGKYTLTGEPSK